MFLARVRTGNGNVTFSVASYSGTTSRTGTLTIAGNTFTVTQVPTCTFTVTPQTVSVASMPGSGVLAVSTQTGCAWTASSSASWITVDGVRHRQRQRDLQRHREHRNDRADRDADGRRQDGHA